MKPVYLTEAASKDVEESMAWYEYQQSDLGSRFYNDIVDSLTRISKNPNSTTMIPNHNVRRWLTSIFPYAIYFKEEPTGIQVIAILHQRMDFERSEGATKRPKDLPCHYI